MWGNLKSIKDGTAWLPQAGTVSQCNIDPFNPFSDKGPHYFAFWEIASGSKEPGNKPQPIAMPVHPGDKISAAVEFEGAGPNGTWEFRLTVFDINDNQRQPGSGTFDQVEDAPGPRSPAKAIVWG